MDNFPYNVYVVTFLNRHSGSIVLLYSKQKLHICLKVKIIDTESHHA